MKLHVTVTFLGSITTRAHFLNWVRLIVVLSDSFTYALITFTLLFFCLGLHYQEVSAGTLQNIEPFQDVQHRENGMHFRV